eukprot:COSAG06_NODE_961_length_11312_cov_10.559351_10_plen_58_part_00
MIGAWAWSVPAILDCGFGLCGVSSSSIITPPRGSAAKPPLLGVVRWLTDRFTDWLAG